MEENVRQRDSCYAEDGTNAGFSLTSDRYDLMWKVKETIHENNTSKHKCGDCENYYVSKGNLIKYNIQTVHEGIKAHVCDVCVWKFSEKSHFDKHKRSKHNIGDFPFLCDICLKGFSFRSDLEVHNRIHTTEKPYECNECLKKLRQQSQLGMHKFVHTGAPLSYTLWCV